MKPKTLRRLTIKFASLVDNPANLGAEVCIAKRDFSQEQRDQMTEHIEKMIRAEGGKFCVYSADGSKNMGCHATREEAMAHLGAIEANKAFVEKIGRKVSGPRMEKIKAAMAALHEIMAEADGPAAPTEEDQMAKQKDTAPTLTDEVRKALDPAVQAYIAGIEKASADSAAQIEELKKAATPPPSEEDVLKALPEAVRKRIEDTEKRLAETETLAKRERDTRLEAEYIAKARGYEALTVEPEKFGPILKRAAETMTAEDFAEVDRVLKAADEAVRQTGVLKPIGKPGGGDSSAWSRIEKRAAEIRKDRTALTKEQALVEAMSENPQLAREAEAEAH